MFLPGSLARTCNVATDRLVYQDVRGLSATEPCPRARIWGRMKPKDNGTPRELGLGTKQALPSTGSVAQLGSIVRARVSP